MVGIEGVEIRIVEDSVYYDRSVDRRRDGDVFVAEGKSVEELFTDCLGDFKSLEDLLSNR